MRSNLSVERDSPEILQDDSSNDVGISHFQLAETGIAVQRLTTLSQRLAAASRTEQSTALRFPWAMLMRQILILLLIDMNSVHGF